MKKLKKFVILTFLCISCSNHNNQKINEYIPNIVDLEGNEINLDDEKGNVVILNLWATWCKPCIAEFESLEKSKEKFIGKKVKIFAISNESLSIDSCDFLSRFLTLSSIDSFAVFKTISLFLFFIYLILF